MLEFPLAVTTLEAKELKPDQCLKTLKCQALLVAVTLLCISSAAAEEKTYKLRLKWFHQFQFAGYYAAAELGYYKEAGINVEILPVNPKSSPVDEVLTGQVHFAVSDSSVVLHKLNGAPVTVLAAIFQSSPLVLISLAEKSLVSPLDFRGKRIMYRKDVDDSLIMAMFNEVGLTEKDFTFVQHTFDDDALLKGDVDVMSAYVTNQPFQYQQRGIPVNITAPANYGIDFYGDMLFTSETLFLQKTDDVLAFRQATIRGWEYALDNPEQVVDWIIKNWNSSKSRESLLYEAKATRRMVKPKLVEVGNLNMSRFRRIAEIYRERDMAPMDSSLDGLHYQDYLQPEKHDRLWLRVTLASLVVAISVLFIFAWINRKLSQRVDIRTRELTRAKKELESTNERLRRMVGYVAHDLRNPLGVIQSLTTLVKHNQVKPEQVIATIGNNAEKSLELVRSILETAALGLGKIEVRMSKLDLVQLTQTSVQGYQVFAKEKGLNISQPLTEPVWVMGDSQRLAQVTDNLLLNAVKYAKPNSEIMIQIRPEQDKVSWTCSNRTKDHQQDSSIDEIFASFGFGMEIVHEILALHDTQAKFSHKNQVFSVIFTLPLAAD